MSRILTVLSSYPRNLIARYRCAVHTLATTFLKSIFISTQFLLNSQYISANRLRVNSWSIVLPKSGLRFREYLIGSKFSAAADRPSRRRGSAHAKYSVLHYMVIKPFLLLDLAAEYRSRRWVWSTVVQQPSEAYDTHWRTKLTAPETISRSKDMVGDSRDLTTKGLRKDSAVFVSFFLYTGTVTDFSTLKESFHFSRHYYTTWRWLQLRCCLCMYFFS